MSAAQDERRPAGDGTALEMTTGQDVVPSMAPTTDSAAPCHDPVDATGIIGGVLVVVVRVDEGRYRRRIYLSLSAAQAAAERARARGQVAEVVLAALAPVRTVGQHEGHAA